ncbi:hypothetical protein E4T56_gene18401 [Termitomyces sp. T112]|nr:hypothetical protein E4T56_gene18401 [Termitomyces sp. T112]
MGVEHSEGCKGECVAGGITRGLAISPRVATTPKGKGKGKAKAREEDEEEDEFEKPIEDLFTNKQLAILLCWQKALMVVDTGAGVVLEKVKGKSPVLPEVSVTTAGQKTTQRAASTQLVPSPAIAAIAQGKAAPIAASHQGVLAANLPRRKARAFVDWQRELAKKKEPIQIKHLSLSQEQGDSGE